jgi:hypothetical protein
LQEGDLVGLVGDEEQIDVAQRMLSFSAGVND